MLIKTLALLKAALVAAAFYGIFLILAYIYSNAVAVHLVNQLGKTVENSLARSRASTQERRSEAEKARLRTAALDLKAKHESARKEAAWDKFFKPTDICKNPPTEAVTVECGNRYIRERRKFEAFWNDSR